MTRTTMFAISVFGAAGLAFAALAPDPAQFMGQWAINGSDSAGTVNLALSRRSNHGSMSNSRDWPVDKLDGLTASQLKATAGSVVKFRIAREPGTLECEGYVKNGNGGGTFVFAANQSFVPAMRTLGFSGLDDEKLFALAVHDVTTKWTRDLRAEGIEIRDTDQLLAMAIHGVSADFAREMKQQGFAGLSGDNLVAMRIHGATPAYVREMKTIGLHPTVDNILAMRIHGVTPEFARQLKDMGYATVSIDQMLAMRIHGASTDYIRALEKLGYKRPSVDQLIAMRIHGVTPEYIQKLQSRGMKNLTVDDLVRMRIHGIAD